MSDDQVSCDHTYVFQGLGYTLDPYRLPGSSARRRYYVDVYYCRKCLDTQHSNKRSAGTSLDPPLQGSFPLESDR